MNTETSKSASSREFVGDFDHWSHAIVWRERKMHFNPLIYIAGIYLATQNQEAIAKKGANSLMSIY